MADRLTDELRARRGALDARLDRPGAAQELDALKAEIGALFKTVDQELTEIAALKDEVMQLVEKWKGLKGAPSLAPTFSGEKPIVHADHLGTGGVVAVEVDRHEIAVDGGAVHHVELCVVLA